MRLWRLTTIKYVDSAFSGKGAALVGGRWSPPGRPVVYASESIALATLEVLVHADPLLVPRHAVIPVDVPAQLKIDHVSRDELTANWQKTPAPTVLRSFGKRWLDEGRSAVLRVPSAIIPQEFNYLLNPLHIDFVKCDVGAAETFGIDGRLWPAA